MLVGAAASTPQRSCIPCTARSGISTDSFLKPCLLNMCSSAAALRHNQGSYLGSERAGQGLHQCLQIVQSWRAAAGLGHSLLLVWQRLTPVLVAHCKQSSQEIRAGRQPLEVAAHRTCDAIRRSAGCQLMDTGFSECRVRSLPAAAASSLLCGTEALCAGVTACRPGRTRTPYRRQHHQHSCSARSTDSASITASKLRHLPGAWAASRSCRSCAHAAATRVVSEDPAVMSQRSLTTASGHRFCLHGKALSRSSTTSQPCWMTLAQQCHSCMTYAPERM